MVRVTMYVKVCVCVCVSSAFGIVSLEAGAASSLRTILLITAYALENFFFFWPLLMPTKNFLSQIYVTFILLCEV